MKDLQFTEDDSAFDINLETYNAWYLFRSFRPPNGLKKMFILGTIYWNFVNNKTIDKIEK